MKANYIPRLTPGAMLNAAARNQAKRDVDEYIEQKKAEALAQFEDERKRYADALDATLFWMLHTEFKFGKKRIRRAWEALIRTRLEFREFLRQGDDEYEEQNTGNNIEDFALRRYLKDMGIDVVQWNAENITYNAKTGEIEFSPPEEGQTLGLVNIINDKE